MKLLYNHRSVYFCRLLIFSGHSLSRKDINRNERSHRLQKRQLVFNGKNNFMDGGAFLNKILTNRECFHHKKHGTRGGVSQLFQAFLVMLKPVRLSDQKTGFVSLIKPFQRHTGLFF